MTTSSKIQRRHGGRLLARSQCFLVMRPWHELILDKIAAQGNSVMRSVAGRYRWSLPLLLVFTLLSTCCPPRVHADGGAPNLAYVSGTPTGVSVIDVLEGKVTKILSVRAYPHTLLLR